MIISKWPPVINLTDVISKFGSIGSAGGPINISAPVISGIVDTGELLSTTDGNWIGASSFTYQWKRGASNIASANSSTYTVVAADLSSNITCEVTASDGSLTTKSTSNILSNEFKAVLEILGASGYLWVHQKGITEALENPVSAWSDVTGTLSFVQPGASSLRPTRKANGLLFDGVDDRMNEDTVLAGWVSDSVWTVGLGSPVVLPDASDVWWGATNNSTTSIVNLTTQNRLGRVGGSTIFEVSPNTGPMSVFISVPSSASSRRVLSGVEITGGYGTQLAGINTFTLGGRRTPAAGIFLNGRIDWFLVANTGLTSEQILSIRTTMGSLGYSI